MPKSERMKKGRVEKPAEKYQTKENFGNCLKQKLWLSFEN